MIRPFQIGDLFLLQRLGRQAVRLNTVQTLIEPQSPFWTSLFSVLPWNQAKLATHILHQAGHGLLGDGFLQVRKRATRAEVDIICLAPALVSERGHPAIWEKLLGHYNRTAARQQIERIYADVPDQPLLVATFNRAGYRTYARQTIWRLSAARIDDYADVITAPIRPQAEADTWALQRLYAHIVPQPVQLAEGAAGAGPLPIVQWPTAGVCAGYVLEARDQQSALDLQGALQIVEGGRGVWLQLWADTNDPNPYIIHELLRYGLSIIHRRSINKPVYVGVHDHQMGLNAVLSDYGFAPVSDRARMVRHVAHWVREARPAAAHVLETSPQIAMVPFHELVPPAQPHSLARAVGDPSLPQVSLPAARDEASVAASVNVAEPSATPSITPSTGSVTVPTSVPTVVPTGVPTTAVRSSPIHTQSAGTLRPPVRIDLIRGRAGRVESPRRAATSSRAILGRAIPRRANLRSAIGHNGVLRNVIAHNGVLRNVITHNVIVRHVAQRVPLGHRNRQELHVEGI